MSLLDDVSIVVTPNGYKAGELYAVVPVPSEGVEEVISFTNGTTYPFTTFATSGNNITSAIVSSAFAGAASNGISVTLGEIYKVTFDYTKNSGDDLRVLFALSANGAASAISNNVIISASGTYTEYFTITSTTTGYLQMGTGNSGHSLNASISNVSVKEYTAADMDVTRNTAATRVDEAGLVNYAEIIGSEEVTNGEFATDLSGWSNKSSTSSWVLGSARIDNSTGNANSGLFQDIGLILGKTYTLTATLKLISADSNGNFVVLTSNSGGGSQTIIYTGDALVIGGASVTETIEFTTADGDVSIQFACNTTNAIFEIDNVSVKEVTRDNVPRIDYSGGGCPHILAEPQRTNLDTTSASGTYGSTPTSEISAIAPDGENTAIRPVPGDASNRYQYTLTGGTYSSGDVLTYSWYRKRFSTPTGSVVTGDLDIKILVNCTQVGVTTEIASSINGYDRFSATVSITDGSLSSILRFYFGNVIEVGNSSVAYWGHQLEQGSYATSYIPTSGSAVTRNQDQFTRDGIGSLINSTEGVLFLEVAALSDDGTNRYFSVSDGTTSNYIYFRFVSTSNTVLMRTAVEGNTINTLQKEIADTTAFNKYAFKWKSGDYAFWINGIEVLTDSSSTVFGSNVLNQIEFSFPSLGGGGSNSKVKQLQVYKTALTDTQLTSLTE